MHHKGERAWLRLKRPGESVYATDKRDGTLSHHVSQFDALSPDEETADSGLLRAQLPQG